MVFDNIVKWVVDLMQAIGGPGVFLAILLENVFPPIPSEVVLPLAGFTAARPDAPYTVVGAVLWATLGSVVGAFLLYWLGAAFGVRRLRWIAERMPLVDVSDVDNAMGWFHRHGSLAILFGRVIPGVRSLISIPAGVDRMPLLTFGVYTTLGSVVWNTFLVSAGYLLGDKYEMVTRWVGQYSNVVYIILAVGVLALLGWLARRSATRRRAATGSPETEPPAPPRTRSGSA